MKWKEQGTTEGSRYVLIPRTLVFLVHDGALLLLRGAPEKRLWANRLNGVGGHVEPDEDPRSAAAREVWEETGLAVQRLELAGIVHVSAPVAEPGVLLFVFTGQAPSRQVRSGVEGACEWHPLDRLPWPDMVDDLPLLLPRILGERRPLVWGRYSLDEEGRMTFSFDV
jgi:8-oxo-dGTP diphosphatase